MVAVFLGGWLVPKSSDALCPGRWYRNVREPHHCPQWRDFWSTLSSTVGDQWNIVSWAQTVVPLRMRLRNIERENTVFCGPHQWLDREGLFKVNFNWQPFYFSQLHNWLLCQHFFSSLYLWILSMDLLVIFPQKLTLRVSHGMSHLST